MSKPRIRCYWMEFYSYFVLPNREVRRVMNEYPNGYEVVPWVGF